MRQTTLTQSGAPGRVIGWDNFSHWLSIQRFRWNFQTLYWICLLFNFYILLGDELPLCIVATLS